MMRKRPQSEVVPVAAAVLSWRDDVGATEAVRRLVADKDVEIVILVDNESSGGLRRLVDEKVRLIESERNLGYAAGMNIALEAAIESGVEYVLSINSDVVWQPGTLAALLGCFESAHEVAAVAPVLTDRGGRTLSRGGRLRRIPATVVDISRREPEFLTWACVLVSVRALRVVGLLDDRYFMYWEDVDWGLRARQQGFHLAVADVSRLVHDRGASNLSAGSRIFAYWTVGLGRMAHHRGRVLGLGLRLRLILRLAARAASGKLDLVVLGLRSWKVGRVGVGPAYKTLGAAEWLPDPPRNPDQELGLEKRGRTPERGS